MESKTAATHPAPDAPARESTAIAGGEPAGTSQESISSPAVLGQGDGTVPASAPSQPQAPTLARSAMLEGLAPADVDFIPPLVHALRTVLYLFGKGVSLGWFMAGLGSVEAGRAPSVTECLRAARRAGLRSQVAERPNLRAISSLTLPSILLLRNDQCCVLTRLEGDIAEVLFPEDCLRSEAECPAPRVLAVQRLEEEYTGYCIFVSPENTATDRVEALHPVRERQWFWDVFAHYMPIYKHVVMASVLINMLGVAASLFAMNVYDRVVPNSAFDTLWVLTFGVCAAYLFDWLLRNLRAHFVDVAGRNADVVLSSKLVNKVLTLRMGAKPDSTGALISNIRDFEQLREFFSSGAMLSLVDLPFLVLFLGLVAFIAGPLVIVPLAAIPLLIGSGLFIQRLSRRAAESGLAHGMQKSALLQEIVSGLETIKVCSAQAHMLRKWELAADESAEAASVTKRYATLSTTVASSISQLVVVILIVWGVYRISEGSLSLGGLIGTNILVGRAMAPLMQIAGMLSRLQSSRLTLRVLDGLMELPDEAEEEGAQVDFGHLQAAFTLDHVSFSYPGSTVAGLDDVTLSIVPGERVGVIGRMGAGKSTFGKLLMGLHTPTTGAVRFGGVDIRQIPLADLRGRMGVLPQDVVLFHDTIRNNIALGLPSASDKLVLRAAYLSGALELVQANPSGFGAMLGERGMNLSGGQRQSIALARALLLDPDVLVLDEPTGNMDNATELTIKTRLAKVLPGKTLVLITHRMSMLDLVDRLIVIDAGRIAADGPKEAVLARLAGISSPGASHA